MNPNFVGIHSALSVSHVLLHISQLFERLQGVTYGDKMFEARSKPQTFPDHNNPQQMRPDALTHTCAPWGQWLWWKPLWPWSLFTVHWFTASIFDVFLITDIMACEGAFPKYVLKPGKHTEWVFWIPMKKQARHIRSRHGLFILADGRSYRNGGDESLYLMAAANSPSTNSTTRIYRSVYPCIRPSVCAPAPPWNTHWKVSVLKWVWPNSRQITWKMLGLG